MRRTFLSIAALALSTWLAGSPAGGQGTCPAVNARLNLGRDLKEGTDFIPVVPDDSAGFYVVYSVKGDGSFTAGMFLFPLGGGDILVFGSGYGDNSLEGPAVEAARVDGTIRGCMGRGPANASLVLVAPHGHLDHVNPAFVEEMEALGYSFSQIVYHEADAFWVDFMSWAPSQRSHFRELRGTLCGSRLEQYPSPLGRIWFTPRPGHTAGAIDLVLDVGNDATNRWLVRGSVAGGDCPPIAGVVMTLEAHGTVVFPPDGDTIRARAEVKNGTGVNRLCLQTDAGPQLGSRWLAMVDPSGTPGAYGVVLAGYAGGLDPGVVTPWGELFLDTEGSMLLVSVIHPASAPNFGIDVPADPAYVGFNAWFQAMVVGDTSDLCNALHVQVGY